MRRLASLALLLTACATVAPPPADLASCSLDAEAACVAYGATIAGVPPRPSAQLLVGLADHAARLTAADAVDTWRRIEELHRAITLDDELLHRRAAPAYAGLAAVTIWTAPATQPGSMEQVLQDGQQLVARVRDLASFAVQWGEPETQLCATHALAIALRWQADNLDQFVLPAELSMTGRAMLDERRETIAGSLREQSAELDAGIAQHRTRYQLPALPCERSEL